MEKTSRKGSKMDW